MKQSLGGQAYPIPTNKKQALLEIVDSGRYSKIVVWHHNVYETELLREILAGYPVLVMDRSDKTDVLDQFRNLDKGILLIRDSLCKGLNKLADADCAIFWSYPLSYKTRSQALGRTCRMNTSNPVTYVIDLVTRGGADEQVHNLLMQKRDVTLTMDTLHKLMKYGGK